MWVNPKLAIKRRKCGPALRNTAMQYTVDALDIDAERAASDVGLCFESHPNVRWPGASQICGWRGTLPLTEVNVVSNTCNAQSKVRPLTVISSDYAESRIYGYKYVIHIQLCSITQLKYSCRIMCTKIGSPKIMIKICTYSSEISQTRCNNCVFILRNVFTLHVSGDNLTHHQEYICCIWPQVSRLT